MIVSPELAPTWKVMVELALSRLMPLKVVVAAMRPISAESRVTSATIAARSAFDSVPFWNWTASRARAG